MLRTTVLALTTITILSACSAPTLRPLYAPGALIQDAELMGEWTTDGPTVARIVVSEGPDGKYVGALTIHRKAELAAALTLEVSFTQIGADRYVDLYLSKKERETLASRYGFLALPVHQFMLVEREGDTARVSMFNADWLRRAAAEHGFAYEMVSVAGREIPVVTADTGALNTLLRDHAHDPEALMPAMVFRRPR